MKRRTFLAGTTLLPLLPVKQWLRQLLLGNNGEVVEKRVLAITDGEKQELVTITSDSESISQDHWEQLSESPGEIDADTVTRLREQYDEIRFTVTVSHHEASLGHSADSEPVEYQTSRVIYTGVDIGDHLAFQTSLLRPNAIISLSCHTDDKASLQQKCRVDMENPTDN